jgi:hypothetical protein
MDAKPPMEVRMRRFTICSATLLCSVVLLGRSFAGAPAELGFVRVFNGTDLAGLQFAGVTKDAFQVEDGVLICKGSPAGYWYTDKSYKNYILRFDWRYKRPDGLDKDSDFKGNSGYLIHITGDHKVWPKCVEVQGMNADAGNIFAIGGAKITGKKDAEVQKAAINPVGEWNRMEITSVNGTLISRVNGQVVSFGTNGDLMSGPIGFQSEGAEIHWRNVRIRELPE